MTTARIAVLLEPFLDRPLTSEQLDQILTYINLLLRWNARINLTAIRNPDQIVTRHFGESFFMARHLFPPPYDPSDPRHPERSGLLGEAKQSSDRGPHRARFSRDGVEESKDPCVSFPPASLQGVLPAPSICIRVLDLGSGAGFPGLPIKIWAPHIHLTLIESNHKKAAFLREVVRALTLTNVNVLAERAETVAARVVLPLPQSAFLDSGLAAASVAGSLPPLPAQASQEPFVVNDSLAPPGANASPRLPAADSSATRPVSQPSPKRPAVHTVPGYLPTADSLPVARLSTVGSFPAADIVTFRAVEKFDRIFPLATKFLAPDGRLALLLSSAQVSRLRVISGDTSWDLICVPQSYVRILAISVRRKVGVIDNQ